MPVAQPIKRKSKKVTTKKSKKPLSTAQKASLAKRRETARRNKAKIEAEKKLTKVKNIIQSNKQIVIVNTGTKRRTFKPKATSLQGQQSRHRMDILAMSRASELGRSNFQGMAEVNHFASQQRDRVGLISSNIAQLEAQVHRLGTGALDSRPLAPPRGRSRLVPPSTGSSLSSLSYGSSLASSSLPPSAYTSLASLSDAGSRASSASLSDTGSRASSMESSLASLSDAGSRASLPSRASSLSSLSGASSLVSSLAPSSVNIPLVPPRPVDTLASRSQSDPDDFKSYGELLESGKTPVEANLIYSRQFDKPESVKSEGSQSSVREELQIEGSQSRDGSIKSERSQPIYREELQSETSGTSERKIPLSRPGEPKPLLTKSTIAEINEQRYYDNIAEQVFGRRGGGLRGVGVKSDTSSSVGSLISGVDDEMRPTLLNPPKAMSMSDRTDSIGGSVEGDRPPVKADLYFVS